MNTLDKIQRIEQDFGQQNSPFDDIEFPEERLLSEVEGRFYDNTEDESLSSEDKLTLLSAFSTFDYNRDANQLVDNLLELHERDAQLFSCRYVTSEEDLVPTFEDIGFRYPNRDAHAWATNCEILRDEYHGRWTELVLDAGCDAPTVVSLLNTHDFLCLKGVKIAPMYARFISQYVTPLADLWHLDIPVDTHIRRLSNDLFARFDGDDSTDDEIREIWRQYGQRYDVNRHVVDGALWQIGNNWDDWGEEYWENV